MREFGGASLADFANPARAVRLYIISTNKDIRSFNASSDLQHFPANSSSRLLPILSTMHCCVSLIDTIDYHAHGERIDKIINSRASLACR